MISELIEKNENDKARILVYGEDGTGKTGFVSSICKNNGKTLVMDFEGTAKKLIKKYYNYDVIKPLFFDEAGDYDIRKILRTIKDIVKELNIKKEYDNIIVDGLTKLVNVFASDIKISRGGDKDAFTKYGKRNERFLAFFDDLLKLDMNLLLVGQFDFNLKTGLTEVETKKGTIVLNKSNAIVRAVNFSVDYKYLLERNDTTFTAKCEKNRLDISKVGDEIIFIRNKKFLENSISNLGLIGDTKSKDNKRNILK